jgi:hypothetical protein
MGMRRLLYRSLSKTFLQHMDTSAAINLKRVPALRAESPVLVRTDHSTRLALEPEFANSVCL